MARRTTKRIALLIGVPLVLGVGVAGATVARNMRRHAKMQHSLAEGTAAYKAGDYAGTMEKFGYYTGQTKSDGEVMYMVADARRKTPMANAKQNFFEAIPYAKIAADRLPNDPRPLEMLLDLYGEVYYFTEQIATADRLLKINPAHKDALEARANGLAATGKLKEAMEAGRARIKADPADVSGYAALVGYQRAARVDNAEVLKVVDEAADAHADDGRFLALKSREHARSGDMDIASAAIKQAVQQKAKSAEGVSEVLAVLDILSPYNNALISEADAFLSREMAGAMSPEVAMVAAERAWKEGRNDLAVQTIARSYDPAKIAGASDNALGWTAFLNFNAARKADDPAVSTPLDALKQRTSDDARYWTALVEGQSLLFADKFLEARSRLAVARTLRPKSELVEYLDADVDQRLGEWRQAANRWSRLVAGRSAWRTLNLSLVSLYLQHRDVTAGVAVARRVYEAHPGSAEALLLARAYAMEVEAEEVPSEEAARVKAVADDLAKRDIPEAPLKNVAQSLAARMYLGLGRQDLAEPLIEELIKREPAPTPDILAALGAALRSRNPALSERILARGGEQAQSPDLVFQSALRLSAAGHADQGRALLESALKQSDGPAQIDYELRLASYLDATGSEEALARFSAAAAKYENEPFAQTALLESQSAWRDEKVVTAGIERLRKLTGDAGAAWKTYEARRLLTFEPSAARAADVYKLLTPVLAQEPRNVMALSLTADAQVLLNDRNQAIALLTTAVDADPERPSLYPRLVELLQLAGRNEEAVTRLTAFSRLSRVSPEMQRRRARLLAAQGMWQPATADFAALAALGSPEDRFAYASMLARQGDAAKAVPLVDDVAAAPTLAEPLAIAVAEFYASRGDIAKGRAVLTDKLRAPTADYKDLTLAKYLLRHKSFDEAEPLFVRLAASNTPDALADLGSFYYQTRSYDKARTAIDRGLAQNPKNARLLRLSGLVKLDTHQDSAQAFKDLRGGLGDDARPEIQKLAQIMEEHEQNPAALDKYAASLANLTKEAPTLFLPWQLLIEARFQQGQMKEAATAARAAVKAIPVDPAPAQLATQALMTSGQFDDALLMAAEWRARTQGNPLNADLAAASILSALNRDAEAAQRLEPWKSRIAADAAANPRALEQLAQTLALAGREPEARELVWPLIDKDEAWAGRALGVAEKVSGTAQQEWLAKVEPILIRQPAGRVALGRTYYAIGNSAKSAPMYDRALQTLTPALETPSTRAAAALLLGGTYESKGDRANAIANYRIAVSARPDDPVSLNNLAYLLIDDPSTQAEAVSNAKRAVELAERGSPDMRRNFLDTLGLSLLRSSKFPEAEEAFRKALALDPAATDSAVGLAEATIAQNKPQDTRRLLAQFDSGIPIPANLAQRVASLRDKAASLK